MHEYFFHAETVRIAIIMGVVVTMLFYERLQLTTGGAIVPGYLALFAHTPLFIGMTLLTGYLTYAFVNKVVRRRFILYGRLKFETEIMTGLVLVALFSVAAWSLGDLHPYLVSLYGIGFVIPGVLAHDMFRQTPRKTLLAVLVNTGIVLVILFVFDALRSIAPWDAAVTPPPFLPDGVGYPVDWLLPAILVSVAAGLLAYKLWDLRTGGFVTGAYLALVLPQPLDLLFAVGVALVTYFVVTRLMMPHLMLFGRRKFSTMVLMGAILAWVAEIAVTHLTAGAYVPWSGFHIITLMIPALLANDAERQGPVRTLAGAAVTTAAVWIVMTLAVWALR